MATEVGSGFISLVPSARGFRSKIEREIGPDTDRAGRTGGARYGKAFSDTTGSTIKSRFAAIGRVAAVGLVAGLAGSAVLLKGSINAASDLNETINKVAVVLGKKATPAVRKFAKRAATDFGQSEQSALDAVATFAVFGKSAGLQGPKLAKFSTQLTGLASDMASFSNTSPEEAIQAIGAALRGESEPIRKYGVLLDDASLRQEALKLGLIETTKNALTPQQRVLAAQALILKQTSDAQGDFGRTSSGLANQQRILSAQFTNLKANIGRGLLPVALTLVRFFNDKLIPGLSKVKDGVSGIAGAFRRGLSGNVSGSGVFRVVAEIGDAVGGVVDKIRSVHWKRLAGTVISGIAAGLAGGAAIWGKIQPDLTAFGKSLFEGARETAHELIDGLQVGLATGNWEPLGAAVADGIGRAASGAAGLTKALGSWLAAVDWLQLGKDASAAAVPFIIGFVNDLTINFLKFAKAHPIDAATFVLSIIPIGRVAGLLEKVLGKLPIVGPLLRALSSAGGAVETGVIRFIVRPLGRIGGFILKALLEGFRLVFPKAGSTLERELGLLGTRIGLFGLKLLNLGKGLIEKLVDGIRSKIVEVGASAGLVVAKILKPFARAGTFLLSAGRDIVLGLARGIRGAAGEVVQAAKDLAGSVPHWVKKILHIGSPSKVMEGLGNWTALGLAKGIGSGAGVVNSAATKLAQGALDSIKNRLSNARSELQGLRDSVRDAVTGTLDIGSLRGGLGAMFDIHNLASRAGQFVKALGDLARKGVAPGLIELIAQAGPEAGLQAAQSIAGMTKAQRKSVNQDFNRLQGFAAQAANIAGQQSGLREQITELQQIKDGVRALVRKRERLEGTLTIKGDESTPKATRRAKLAATLG